jgi:hypothetical protein
MARTITARLMESFGFNRGLFGRRRLREQADEKGLGQTWRDEAYKRLVDLHRNGKHAEAHAMLKGIEEADAEDEDALDAPAPDVGDELMDQSQAGRGEPFKRHGEINRGPTSPQGLENMESREAKVRRYLDHGEPRHISVLESRGPRKTPAQIWRYSKRLLRD